MLEPTTASSSRDGPEAESSGGFAQISRRIAGWTTNGLATGLVLLAGLTLGRQVLIWWREPEPAQQSAPRETLNHLDGQRQLEFGALATTIQLRTVDGTRDDALRTLRSLCRPEERPDAPAGSPPSHAERRLLAGLTLRKPVEAGDGWRLDEFPRGLPLVICSTYLAPLSSDHQPQPPSTPSGDPPEMPVPLDLRIVSIGLAFPGADGRWNAYAFRVDGQAGDAVTFPLPLPDQCQRGLTLTQPDGSQLATIRGKSTPAAWEEAFRRRLTGAGWRIVGDPVSGQGTWRGQFIKTGAKSLRSEVFFEYDGQGEVHGLVLVSPVDP